MCRARKGAQPRSLGPSTALLRVQLVWEKTAVKWSADQRDWSGTGSTLSISRPFSISIYACPSPHNLLPGTAMHCVESSPASGNLVSPIPPILGRAIQSIWSGGGGSEAISCIISNSLRLCHLQSNFISYIVWPSSQPRNNRWSPFYRWTIQGILRLSHLSHHNGERTEKKCNEKHKVQSAIRLLLQGTLKNYLL